MGNPPAPSPTDIAEMLELGIRVTPHAGGGFDVVGLPNGYEAFAGTEASAWGWAWAVHKGELNPDQNKFPTY